MEESRRVVRVYNMNFKIDAVRLVVGEGYGLIKAAERLGISPKNLYHWKRHFLQLLGSSSRPSDEKGTADG